MRRFVLVRRPGTAALAVTLLVTGCASTIQVRSAGNTPYGRDALGQPLAAGGSDASAGTVDPADGSATAGEDAAGTGSTDPGQVAGAPGGTTSGRTTAGAGSSSSRPGQRTGPVTPGPATGFGFTATTATIGIEYSSSANATFKSAGLSSLSTGDDKALTDTMLAQINAAGGVLGHQIKAVYQDTDATQAVSNQAVAAQATCAAFTQDNQVFAGLLATTAQACMTQAKVASANIAGGIGVDDTELAETAPFFRRPLAYSNTHMDPVLVGRLAATGFLTKSSKIGILWPDAGSDSGSRIKDNLKKLLAARGFTVAADYGYDYSSGTSPTTSVPNAVLPFRSAGVDRVIGLDADVAYFMISAQQQGYHPLYALNSNMNLASVMESVPPAAQLVGSVGIGWEGSNDVDSVNLDVKPPAFDTCMKYISDSGQAGATGAALFILLGYCNTLRLYLFAAQAGGGFDPASLQRGLAQQGTSFQSSLVTKSGFSATRMDGADGARDIAYDSSCSCFKYGSPALYSS